MENLVMDQSSMNTRRSLNNHGLEMVHAFSSGSELLVNVHGSPRPPRSLYSSLPSPFRQPPLLPSPSKRMTAAAGVKPGQHKKKPKSSSTKSPSLTRSEPKSIAVEDDDDEEFLQGRSLYSISPPPSSLPMPRFSLTRPKAAAAATVAGASDNLRRLLHI